MKKIAIFTAFVLTLGMLASCAPAEEQPSQSPVVGNNEAAEAVNLSTLVDVYRGEYTPDDISGGALFDVQDFDGFAVSAQGFVADTAISAEGSYRISGENAEIFIDAPDATVQLILDAATIIGGISATCEKLVLTIDADSEISVEGKSAIQTSGALVINGGATLKILATAAQVEEGAWAMPSTAIYAGGDVVLASIGVEIENEGAGIYAMGGFNLHSGTYTITTPFYSAINAGGDVHIDGGVLTVLESAGGIGGANVYITDGTIDIKSSATGIVANGEMRRFESDRGEGAAIEFTPPEGEGAELPEGVMPFDGTTTVGVTEGEFTIGEDGTITGADGQPVEIMPFDGSTTVGEGAVWGVGAAEVEDIDADVRIVGGIVTINAEREGLGSNGSVYIDGGEVYVSVMPDGGGAALSYAKQALVTGGTAILVGGQSGAMGFGSDSTQYSFLVNLPGKAKGGTLLNIVDGSNNVMVKTTPMYDYQSVVVSTPALKEGGVYTLVAGTVTARVTVSQMSEGSDSWTAGGRRTTTGGGMFVGGMFVGGMAGGEMRGMLGELRPGETRKTVGPNGENVIITGGGEGSVGFSTTGGAGGSAEFIIGEIPQGATGGAGGRTSGGAGGSAPAGGNNATVVVTSPRR